MAKGPCTETAVGGMDEDSCTLGLIEMPTVSRVAGWNTDKAVPSLLDDAAE